MTGYQCECSRMKRPRAPCCDECKRLDRERYAAERESDISGAVRRLLGHHSPDWIDGAEIVDVVGPMSSAALWNLFKSGVVEKRWEKGFGMVYRLAAEQKRRVA